MFDAPARLLPKAATWSLILIATLLLVASLRLADNLVAPIALGLVFALVLAPLVSLLQKMGVPRAISATAALLTAGGLSILMIALLGPVLIEAMEQMPRIKMEVQWWLQRVTFSVRGLDEIGDELNRTITEGGNQAVPTIVEMLWMAPDFLGQMLIFAGTLFFFLLTRDDIYATFGSQKLALYRADRAVSHYFVTITMINAGLGLTCFAVMGALGLSYPMLWGLAAFVLNFLLYLGPITLIGALTIAGISQFSGIHSFLPPLAFFAMNLTESQFVTPMLVGQKLHINPLGVFLAILFGLWLWGPIGAIVAIPLMIWLTTFCASTPAFTKEELI
ncbi:AI-2E family transporter [Primorskyibacter sp. 2E233]|uniref:AI-2E family transporter n=1 Tax=Primorskyibacter sp. 2E233 TaxID=3413431 RepID=UPI003BF0FBE0